MADGKLLVPGGLLDTGGRPVAVADAPTAPLSEQQQQAIDAMRASGAITPDPEISPVISPYHGPAFTLNDEYDRVVCGLIPPRTYVFTDPQRFQFDAFKVITDLLLSPEGQRIVAATGWRVHRP
jgi:hypothetical protein